MKFLVQFLPVFIICILCVFVLPHMAQLPTLRGQSLPVSVTSLGAAAPLMDAPEEAVLPAGAELAGYAGLDNFAAPLLNGQADALVGVYVPGVFALPVRQQPAGQPDFVSVDNDILTEFSLPKKYGSLGLLAHNYLSGSLFYLLKENQDIVLVYGNGRTEQYRVSRIAAFQALKPNSPFSDFVDLSHPTAGRMTSAGLFNQVYTTRNQVVFQTCIAENDEPSWGRIFIIASQVQPLNLGVPTISPFNSNN